MGKKEPKNETQDSFLALAALTVAAVAAGMLLLYFAPRSDIPDDGAVVVQQNGDGSFLLSWTELDGADGYQVEILQLMEPDKDDRLTYQRVMTNGTYALNSFLAKGASRHNFGVALDLTLVDLETGEELRMQTSMHDLSWYSVTGHNNANARQLASIMTEAGFSPLSSEWWHFQDDESWKQLELIAVWEGISPEGWVYDDAGWRYRDRLSAFYQSCTVQIGAHFYNFDENGYLIGGDAGFG